MNDLTTQRLITNALWRQLRDHRWRGPTSTRRLSDHGNQPPQRAITNGRIPRAPSLNDTIRQNTPEALAATIHPDERNGLPAPLHICLWRKHYLEHLTPASQATREDLALAIVEKAADPYGWEVNGRGEHHMLRTFEPFHTDRLIAFLLDLAAAASTWREDQDPLISDSEVVVSSRREIATSTT